MRQDALGCNNLSVVHPHSATVQSQFWIPTCSAPVAVFGAHSDIFSIHAFLPCAASWGPCPPGCEHAQHYVETAGVRMVRRPSTAQRGASNHVIRLAAE